MTIEEFSKQTAWPLEELGDLYLNQVEDLFALYGLVPTVVMSARGFWHLLQHVDSKFLLGVL